MITKSPQNINNYTREVFLTSSARIGWKHILLFLNLNKPEKILLPAYIGRTEREGSGVFDPVLETNTPFEFYSLDKQLRPDIYEIKQKITSGTVKLLFIIHYFGFLQSDLEELYGLCKNNDVLLFEDCAHAFHFNIPNYTLGSYGDFSIFSIHKFLPTEDGGILKINNPNLFIPPIPEEYVCPLKTLIQFTKSDLQTIVRKRARNYNYLLDRVRQIEGITPIYSVLPPNIIPLNFPVIIGSGLREKIYFKLLEKNIPTIALYYRLIDEIPEKDFPVSQYLSKNILNLPIHQDVELKDIDYLVEELALQFN